MLKHAAVQVKPQSQRESIRQRKARDQLSRRQQTPLVDNRPQTQARRVHADSTPEEKKRAASIWLQSHLSKTKVKDPAELTTILGEAKNKFHLKNVLVDFTNKGQAKIGLEASPISWIGSKFIGNTVSDWGLWSVYGSYSTIRDSVRANPTAASQSHITYGPLTGRGFGSYMLADPLTRNGPAGSSPSVTNPTWEALLARRQNGGGRSSYYVRGHLLNDQVHGTGADWKNLTPLTQRTNNHSKLGHEKKVEKEVKTRTARGEVLCYQVIPKYGRVFELPRYIISAMDYFSNSTVSALAAAESFVPQGLWCKLWFYDAHGKRQPILNEFIKQMEVGKVSSDYWVKTPAGTINLADNNAVWAAVKATFLITLTGLLGLAGSAATLSLLTGYATGIGLTVPQLIAQHSWNVQALVGLLGAYSGYKSSGKNPWPIDKSRDE